MAAYFGIPTGAAERETERIVDSVRQAFLHVSNLQGICFLNSSKKGMQITDLNNRAAGIVFFTFRSTITADMIDPRFPSTTLSLDFLLRLPQSDIYIALAPTTNLNSALNTSPGTPIQSSASSSSVTSVLTNATEDVLKAMDETQLRQFISDTRNFTNPTPAIAIPSVNILSSFTSCSSTPKMDRVRTSVASSRLSTYLRPMDLLDNQASFVSVFSINHVILRVSKRAAGTCVIEDTEYLATKLGKYCDAYQLHLFCDIVKLQFVGTIVYDSHRMMHDIYLSLSSLKLESRVNRKTTYLTPDSLFQRFIEFTPLLSPNATSWSFSLVTLFYNALGVELQESIRLDGYFLPNNSTLPTLFDQTSALQVLREIAVMAHQSLATEKSGSFD